MMEMKADSVFLQYIVHNYYLFLPDTMGNLIKSNHANDYHSIKGSTLEDHYPQRLKSSLLDENLLRKVPLNVKIVQKGLLHRKQILKAVRSKE
jgi:hypothetical protein